ncbi:MAG: FIST N-terminal domain-containing protein [Granulosicoccaceae bacterium]
MPVAFTIGDRPFGLPAQTPSVEPFSLVHACASEPKTVAKRCLSQIQRVPADVTFGLVYVTAEMGHSFETTIELLRLELPNVNWVGAIVPAIFAGEKQYQGEPAMAIMLGSLALDQFRIMSSNRRSVVGQLDRLRAWRLRNGSCDAIVHGDANNQSLAEMADELSWSLGSGAVSGGLNASRRENLQVAVSVTSGGMSGVLLGRDISLLNGYASGAAALGLPHAITASRGNDVLELDHEPALDVLFREAGELLARDPQRLAGFISAACGPHPGEGPAYQQRRFVELNLADRSFRLDDLSTKLDCLRFYRRDPLLMRQSFDKMLIDLNRRLDGRAVRAAILISSAPRQGGVDETAEELTTIRSLFGNIPLLGYRSSGEIYNGARLGNSSVLSLIV